MKASMKKELRALQVKLTDHVAEVQTLLSQEEDYSSSLTNDDKLEESENRQELLTDLGEILEAASETLNELLTE